MVHSKDTSSSHYLIDDEDNEGEHVMGYDHNYIATYHTVKVSVVCLHYIVNELQHIAIYDERLYSLLGICVPLCYLLL